jgi:CBS domain containing-hemolysin-like protein
VVTVAAQAIPAADAAAPGAQGAGGAVGWYLLLALLLVLLNGFFVAAEFALVKVRGTRVRELADAGNWRARVAASIVAHIDAYLSAAQLGITFASIGLGWIGEPAVARLVGPCLEWVGVTSPRLVSGISFAVAFAIISFFHIVLGELAPKSLAIRKAESVSLWVAAPFRLFYWLFYPAIVVLNGAANLILRAVRIAPVAEGDPAHSPEELRMIVAASHAHGDLNATERRLLENAIGFSERRVAEIMVPRADIVALSAARTTAENRRTILETRHTRFPVVRRSLDDVMGMVHVKDILRLWQDARADAPLASIMRPIVFVPETATIDQVLRTFQQRRILMAMVVDEYGMIVGLVTVEDVIEELVGRIGDEFSADDRGARAGTARAPGVLDGGAPVDVLATRYHIRVPPDVGVFTVGGYLLKALGRLPAVGDRVTIEGHVFEVVSMEGRRITGVRVQRAGRGPAAAAGRADGAVPPGRAAADGDPAAAPESAA